VQAWGFEKLPIPTRTVLESFPETNHEAIYEPGVDRLVARVGNGARLKQHLLASHTLAEDVGRVATEAGIGLLALNHLVPADDPLVTEGHWMEAVRRHYAGPLMIGHDGLTLPLTSAHLGSSAPGKA
jgi:ribonuclease BN (tRNA processing enzyme)